MFRFVPAQVGRRAELRELDDDLSELLWIELRIDLTEDFDAPVALSLRLRLLCYPRPVRRQGRLDSTPMVKRSACSLRERWVESGELGPVLEQRMIGMCLVREVLTEEIPLLGRAEEGIAKMALSPA